MPPKVYDVLHYLVTHTDRVVTKNELLDAVWPNTAVSDAVVRVAVSALRKALGDTTSPPRYIATSLRRGYRFLAPVTQAEPQTPEPAEASLDLAGAALPATETCRTCGQVVPLPATFCHGCGQRLETGAPVLPAAPLPAEGTALPQATGASSPVLPVDTPVPLAMSPPPSDLLAPRGQRLLREERRQLTVLWCRWAVLASADTPLDPEALLHLVQEAQQMCDEVIEQCGGRVAQQFAEGFAAYFGHPQAHEDDARRAVRAGLAMLRGVTALAASFSTHWQMGLTLQVGIHTGMAVLGPLGQQAGRAALAVGRTPQMAAQLVSLAAPNTVVISSATLRLVEGYVVVEPLGSHLLAPSTDVLVAYQVLRETAAQTRLDVGLATGLTAFVGREPELGLLRALWAQSQAGQGQVVVLHGEAGIGKSRLALTFLEQLAGTAYTLLAWRGAAQDQHSALQPVLVQLRHWLQGQGQGPRNAPPALQAQQLEAALRAMGCRLEDEMPVWAALLALPLSAAYRPLALPPEAHKQRTQAALLWWLLQQTTQQPVCLLLEDAHWLDPSTLEVLGLLMDHVPMARLLLVVTCRPEFVPPWTGRSYVTQLALSRLPPEQTARLIDRVVAGKALPPEVHHQLVEKTNGVPLFIEELTKMVLESGLVKEDDGHYALAGPLQPLAIPATLADSLMARLDRHEPGKVVAQVGAAVGRDFAYTLLQAVAPLAEDALQEGLAQLVRADLLQQRGLPPQAQYRFKHALIQDAAYHSLLPGTLRAYHQRIAQTLVSHCPDTLAAQPELVASHYTAAGCRAEAVPYWQQAGQQALARSAYQEAQQHLEQGLALLEGLPPTAERAQQELRLQMVRGPVLMAVHGQTAAAVLDAYGRAHGLCRQLGGGADLFPVLLGLWRFYGASGRLQTSLELAQELMQVAARVDEPALRLAAHMALGNSWFFLGRLTAARTHFQYGMALYAPPPPQAPAALYGRDPGVVCHTMQALTLWRLGYPAQAQTGIETALTLAQACGHPLSLAFALCQAAALGQWRQEPPRVRTLAAAALTVATEYGLGPWILGQAMLPYGWALVVQGERETGLQQMRQGLGLLQQIHAELPWSLFQLVDGYRHLGWAEEGLHLLRATASPSGLQEEPRPEVPGLSWLEGELLLQQAMPDTAQAEACFLRAIAVARTQEAKSDELRATLSLCRLWHTQGKKAAAQQLLQACYGWFTEGWETPDLCEARNLLAVR